MAKQTTIQTVAHPRESKIEVITLYDNSPISSIKLSVEQAVEHMKAIVKAVDLIQGKPSGLILPANLQ